MQRVEQDAAWSLFCPNEAPGLANVWGAAFESLYHQYEREGRARKVIKARALWQAVLESQTETGTPYICYKDSCNGKSNQQNLGTIRSSNLCTEIMEYTAPDEIAVCNLASIALPMFVNADTATFDHQRLFAVTQVVTKNLNKVIDINYYPVKEAENSNMRHRPIGEGTTHNTGHAAQHSTCSKQHNTCSTANNMAHSAADVHARLVPVSCAHIPPSPSGIGVQGLADAFILMRFPFDSPSAAQLNKDIFETIYYGALTASCELAAKHGPYATYAGSPVSKGILQFDMWNVTPASNRWDWTALKAKIAEHGVRNSLLVAPMPTASTSQILGNNEGE